MVELTLDDLLPVTTARGLGQRAQRRAAAHRLAQELLATHWPALSQLVPATDDNPVLREALLTALRGIEDHRVRIDTHRAVEAVILVGNRSGLWTLAPLPAIAQHALAPSRIAVRDAATIDRVQGWRIVLGQHVDQLVVHADAHVRLGAAVLALVLETGVLHTSLLQDLLAPSAVALDVPEGLHVSARVDGRASRMPRWRGWILAPAAARLWHQGRSAVRPSTTQLDRALHAVCALLNEDMPTTVTALLVGARTFWAAWLPPALWDIATDPTAVAALRPEVLAQRVVRDKRLIPAQVQRGARAQFRDERLRWRAGHVHPAKGSARDQALAYRALRRVLARDEHGEPDRDTVMSRMEAWRQRHGVSGGWVGLLADWIQHVLSDLRVAGLDRALKPSSVRRYLNSFGAWLIELAGDLDPMIVDEPTLMARMEVLEVLATQDVGGIRRLALQEFLDFASGYGMAPVDLRDWWAAIREDGIPDANLLTPAEFARVLVALDAAFAQGDPYRRRRTRAIALLAFRAGVRWGELCGLRLGDVRILGRGRWQGVSVRITTSKTANGPRELPLHQLLPREELQELVAFVVELRAGQYGVRKGADLLFGEPDAPMQAPLRATTRDVIQVAMRRASGDPSLVFHHLRHSTANWVLLHLMGHLHSGALASVSEGMPAPPADARSYHAWVLGHDDHHVTGVVLAALLGHLDVGVTLAHYIHLVEFLLARATRQQPLPLSDRAKASLLGIQPASLQRRRLRAKRSEHQTN